MKWLLSKPIIFIYMKVAKTVQINKLLNIIIFSHTPAMKAQVGFYARSSDA
jgi:hypothetical protein